MLNRASATRVSSRFLAGEWLRIAKPEYLRAIDFVAGLIKRFELDEKILSTEVPNKTLLRRVLQMRKAVQDGFDLGVLAANDTILEGIGQRITSKIEFQESQEAQFLPKERDYDAFMKTFPNKKGGYLRIQTEFLRRLIIKELRLGGDETEYLEQLVMSDREFYSRAFEVVRSYVVGQKASVASLLSGAPGKFEIRNKEEKSSWDKSRAKKVPFYSLADLLGCRSTTSSIPDMAHACLVAQSSLDIVEKDNRYLDPMGGYNAVHYTLFVDNLIVEYQVKALVNKLEAAISHDLIMSDDKFRHRFDLAPLPVSQKKLIRRVIDVSTQLGLNELKDYFELPLIDAGGSRTELLYGGDLEPEELENRLQFYRLARFFSATR